MQTVLFGILIICLLGMFLLPRRQPPVIIYVERERAPNNGGLGCLPALVLIGLLVFVFLSLAAR